MRGVVIPAARINPHIDCICYELPRDQMLRDNYIRFVAGCAKKGIHYHKLIISPPGRPRTTGERSQSHRINGFCQWISKTLDLDFDSVKHYMKRLAVSDGYPFDTMPDGSVEPWSEARITMDQATILIRVIERFAAEHQIPLPEYDEDGNLMLV